MKISILFILLLFVACQSTKTDEPNQIISKKTDSVNNTQDLQEEIDYQEPLPEEGVNINQPSWDLLRSAFSKIDSFPINGSIFPLQAIIIENDTLKMDGDICYSFPLEVTSDFIEKHVDISDSLAIWFEENSSHIGKGTSFEYGIYPFGNFEYASNDYYIYYVLDYLTGRGSFDLSFYIATATNQKWESTYLGEVSHSKFNTYETIEGEDFFKERMVSEQNLIFQLHENRFVINQYSGVHVDGDEFNVFENGKDSTLRELILK